MSQSQLEASIGSLVAERIDRSRVFEKFGLDYCCGGGVALGDACKQKAIDPATVLAALTESDTKEATDDQVDWLASSMTELADHIEATHHAFLNGELPRLVDVIAKVVNAHGERHPELAQIAQIFSGLKMELTEHMAKEEQILFPIIRQMESNGQAASHCGSVANPINVMEHEHNNAGQALASLRTLTKDYTPPADGCTTYQAMMAGLSDLEFDLHQHIHKESNILFPRAIEFETKLLAGQ